MDSRCNRYQDQGLFGGKLRFWCEHRWINTKWPAAFAAVILLATFVVYSYAIIHGRFYLGGYDNAQRFLIALTYAHNPGQALNIEPWLGVWPPIPSIIQGFVLRSVFSSTVQEIGTGIAAVELTGVIFVLAGFFLVGRSVASQTDENTGALACILGLCASTMLRLAPTAMSEGYAFFFVAFGIWNLFRFIRHDRGFGWSVLSFGLAFFTRLESLVVALVSGALLFAYRRYLHGWLLVGSILILACGKFLLSISLVEGTQFFEYGEASGISQAWPDKLRMLRSLIRNLINYNKPFLLLTFICAIPLTYYAIKLKKSPLVLPEDHESFRVEGRSDATGPGSRRAAGLKKHFIAICSWVMRVPVAFWGASFLVSIGVLVAQVLQGNINAQSRYLAMANVFMTTVVALLVAQTVRSIFRAADGRFGKPVALTVVFVLVVFAIGSGFYTATGRISAHNMTPAMKDLIAYMRQHNAHSHQIAFDFLDSDAPSLAIQLLDLNVIPHTQFTGSNSRAQDSELTSLLPKELQRPDKRSLALLHAYIHVKRPRFLVIASAKHYHDFYARKTRHGLPMYQSFDRIKAYLQPATSTQYVFAFQSPYIYPDAKILFRKVHENENYVVLERLDE